MSSPSKTFGKEIAKERKNQGLSQDQLAVLAKMDRSYLSRIERGLVSVTLEKATDLSVALKKPLRELI